MMIIHPKKMCDSMLSEAEQYYELKNDRKKRKRVLLEVEEKRKRTRQYEKEKEEEVHAAYQTFKKARRQTGYKVGQDNST